MVRTVTVCPRFPSFQRFTMCQRFASLPWFEPSQCANVSRLPPPPRPASLRLVPWLSSRPRWLSWGFALLVASSFRSAPLRLVSLRSGSFGFVSFRCFRSAASASASLAFAWFLSFRRVLVSFRFALLRFAARASASFALFHFQGSSFRLDQGWRHCKSSIRWV